MICSFDRPTDSFIDRMIIRGLVNLSNFVFFFLIYRGNLKSCKNKINFFMEKKLAKNINEYFLMLE